MNYLNKSGGNLDNREYLRKKAYDGLRRRGCIQSSNYDKDKDYIQRLEDELNIINKFGFADFILDVSYICLLCKSKNILIGPGRGSVGGSLVAYTMGITNIDPLKFDLSFARFLNPGRSSSLPDIDIDVGTKQRQEVIQLMKQEFGEDSTYQFINIIKFTEKTALKDLARIFNVPFDIINRITSKMNSQNDREVQDFLNKYPQIKQMYPYLIDLNRSYGVHAGGIILAPDSIDNYASLVKVNGLDVIGYDKRVLEDNLFLKQDLLGLKTLSIIQDTFELIGVEDFEDFDYDLDDQKVYETINRSTLGIFQLEGMGAAEYTYKLKPDSFDMIVADLALVRPGAMDSGDADTFLRVKDGLEEVSYDHPSLQPILSSRMGCIIYQEQAMQIAKSLAGFTDSEADILRKGIGKKLDYIFEEYKPKFIQGCLSNDIDQETAETIWNKIEKSSSYSFNKSHSVGYSMITYQTAYLKTYYPIEFYLALLNNTDDEEKRTKIYNEMKTIDKNIKNPDINISKEVMVNRDNDVYLSFSLIKGIGEKAIKSIIDEQPYLSFDDFMNRKDSRKVNRRVVEALVESGCFDSFNSNRALLMATVNGEQYVPWSEEERLFREYNRLKINPKGDLLSFYDISNYNITPISISSLKKITEDQIIYIKVMITGFKSKDNYGFLTVSDNQDSLSIYCSQKNIDKYITLMKTTGSPVIIKLRVRNGKATFINMLNLKDTSQYRKEESLLDGTIFQQLHHYKQKYNNINVGIAVNTNFFMSKKGNDCVRFDILQNEKDVLTGRMCVNNYPENLEEGSIIMYFVADSEDMSNPFTNIYGCV